MTDAARHRAPGPAAGAPGVDVVRSEERLLPGVVREPVERVTVHRDVVVEEVTQTVEVRREVLRIEREAIPPGGSAPPPDADGADRVVEVVLREERPVVDLEVVPVERVRVRVISSAEVVPVTGEVRTEHVEVEAPPTVP